jgi:hypothetical protein
VSQAGCHPSITGSNEAPENPRRRDMTLAIRTNDIQPLSEGELATVAGGLIVSLSVENAERLALARRLTEAFKATHGPSLPPLDL